jgi:uncharacterized membrane protein YbhN (UPF0104 family)
MKPFIMRITKLLKKHKALIRWIIALILLSLIIKFFVNNNDKLSLFLKLQKRDIFLLLALQIAAVIVHAARLKIIAQKFMPKNVSFLKWLQIFTVGRLFNMFVSQSGNLYRTVTLKSKFQLTHTHYISSLFAYAWIDMTLNLALATICFAATKIDLYFWGIKGYIFLSAITATIITLPFILFYISKIPYKTHLPFEKITLQLAKLKNGFMATIVDYKLILKVLILGLVSFTIMISTLGIIFQAVDINLNLAQLALIYVILKISIYLILTPGNLGLREILLETVARSIHLPLGYGLVSSIIIRFSHLAALLIMVFFYYIAAFIVKFARNKNQKDSQGD